MSTMEANVRPPFSSNEARAILQRHYGITATSINALPSELDRNFHLRATNGEQYVFKIAHSSVSASVLDLQTKALHHLRAEMGIIPEVIPAKDGADTIRVKTQNGAEYRARLLSYIDGIPLSDFRPHSVPLLADLALGPRSGNCGSKRQH